MNWDQIEVKWAAMARRVRSDLPETARPEPSELRPAPLDRDGAAPPLPRVEEATQA